MGPRSLVNNRHSNMTRALIALLVLMTTAAIANADKPSTIQPLRLRDESRAMEEEDDAVVEEFINSSISPGMAEVTVPVEQPASISLGTRGDPEQCSTCRGKKKQTCTRRVCRPMTVAAVGPKSRFHVGQKVKQCTKERYQRRCPMVRTRGKAEDILESNKSTVAALPSNLMSTAHKIWAYTTQKGVSKPHKKAKKHKKSTTKKAKKTKTAKKAKPAKKAQKATEAVMMNTAHKIWAYTTQKGVSKQHKKAKKAKPAKKAQKATEAVMMN